jgi:hypothetical protein
MCSVEGSCPSYLKLPYPESALALIQHTIREAVSDRPAERLITSDNYSASPVNFRGVLFGDKI